MRKCAIILLMLPFLTAEAYDNLDYGKPSYADQILDREGYALGYSVKWKQPRWVSYRLTLERVTTHAVGRSNHFQLDPELRYQQADPADYKGSGFDRGHNAPSADMKWSALAMQNCFYMSNMSPQVGACNSGIWNEIENTVRGFACTEGSVFVVSGPYVESANPKTIGRVCKVAVPDWFWKVVYDETPPCKMIACLVPNRMCSGRPEDYACSVAEIERKTGLKFFELLPFDKSRLKKSFDVSLWDWSKTQKAPKIAKRSSSGESTATAGGFQRTADGRLEYFAGSEMPVSSRKACPITADFPDTGYWLSTNSGKRHGRTCDNYRKTRGYPCGPGDGSPCGKCKGGDLKR